MVLCSSVWHCDCLTLYWLQELNRLEIKAAQERAHAEEAEQLADKTAAVKLAALQKVGGFYAMNTLCRAQAMNIDYGLHVL